MRFQQGLSAAALARSRCRTRSAVVVWIAAELLPARSPARVLAISCSPVDITCFVVGAGERLKNSLANSGNYFVRSRSKN